MLFFEVGGSGRRPVESADPGRGPVWWGFEGTCFVGIYLVYNRLMVIEGPGLGTESVHKCSRGVPTFRGYMQSKSMSGLWEAHEASDGISDVLSEIPGSMVGSHLDSFSIPPDTILASDRGLKRCLATILGKGCI